jgi:hypothetical protein
MIQPFQVTSYGTKRSLLCTKILGICTLLDTTVFPISCKIEEVSSSQHTTQQIITQTAHPLGHSIIATVLKTVKDETYIPVSILDFV